MTEENAELEEQTPAETEVPIDDLPPDKKILAKIKETVILQQEDIGTLRRKLTITVPRETIDERLGEQFDELRRDANVPGFRKGRAPMRLVEKRYASDVGDQLIAQLVSTSYLAATEKHDIKALGEPLLWVKMPEERPGDGRKVETEKLVDVETALEHMRLPAEGPLVYSCEIELRPEFELPPLAGIPVTKPNVSITDADVEEELRRVRAMRSTLTPVEAGPIEADDAVIVDMKCVSGETVIQEEKNALVAARDQRYSGLQLTGFGAAIVGKRAGDVVTLDTTVPDEHENIELRGQPAKVEATVREFKRFVLPDLTPDLLASLGFDSEQELRDTLRNTLESRLSEVMQQSLRGQVAKYLIDHTKLDLPSGLSQRQADRLVARRTVDMLQRGVPEQVIAKHVDELRTAAQEEAVSDLKLFFITEKIAEAREVDVSEDELNGAIAAIAARRNTRFDRMRDELSRTNGLQSLILQLRDNKVLDALLGTASVTQTEGPAPAATRTDLPAAAAEST